MSRVQYKMDFVIKSSPNILFNFLSTPSGLAQWFADHVDNTENDFSFFWKGFEEKAVLLAKEDNVFVRFQMEDADSNEFFEFSIQKSPVTGDTILIITDFADDDEVDDQKNLWQSQVKSLTERVGGGNA